MLCPNCAAAVRDGEALCPACGVDLSDVLSAQYLPDLFFNEALTLLQQKRWSEACDTLCRARALRPDDAGIVALWVRAEYGADNKKRAVELAADLIDLDDIPENRRLLEELSAEYDREQSAGDVLVRRELAAQSERLSGLLDRMERALGAPETAVAPAAPLGATPPANPAPQTPAASAAPSSKERQSPFRGKMPSFASFFGDTPPKGGKA